MTPRLPKEKATQCQISLPHKELFHLLVEHTPAAIAILDSQMHYLQVSQHWLSDYGLSEGDIIGKSHCEVFAEDLERWQEIYNRCQTGETVIWEEESPQIESDTTHFVRWKATHWHAGTEQQQCDRQTTTPPEQRGGLILFAEKIVTCSSLNERSRRQNRREQLVRSIAARIHTSLTLEEILKTTVDEVRHFLETDRVLIYRLHPEGNGSVVVESAGSEWIKVLGRTLSDPCFNEQYIQLYRHGRTQVVADIEKAGLKQCHIDFLKQFQVKANLVVPIIQDSELWGLLCAHQCKSPRIWQRVEVNLLQQLATHVAIAIQQSSLHEQIQRELAERKATEAALKQSEARFQKLCRNVPGMIYQFLLRPDGSVSFPFVSPGCYSLFGLSAKEIEADAQPLLSMIHPNDRENFQNLVAVSAQTLQSWKWEGRGILPSGEVKWFQAASQPEKQPNGDILWDGLLMDVTARKTAETGLHKAKQELEMRVIERTAQLTQTVKQLETEIAERQRTEAELRESQQKHSLLFEQTQLAVIEWNANFEVTNWNPAAEAIFGYSKAEAIGQHADKLIVPENPQEQGKRDINHLLAQTGGSRSTNKNVTKDGETIICDWYTTPLIDTNGVFIGFASLGLDMTEQATAEAALRENEERYRTVVEDASDGILLVDLETKQIVEANAACCNCLGYSQAEMLALSIYDIVAYEPEIVELFTRRVLRERHSFYKEGKHRHKNGSVLDTEVSVNIISYGGKELLCIIFRDVTERKRTEELLLRISKAVESSSDAIAMSDATGHHIYQNPAFSKLFEYETVEELNLVGGPHTTFADQGVASDVFSTIMSGSSWIGEVEQRTRSGRAIQVLMRADAIKDPNGEIIGLIGISTDITERKRAEQALREQQAFLQNVLDTIPHWIFVKDWEGRFVLANQAVADAYRTSPSDLIGKKDADFNPNQEEVESYLQQDREVMTTLQEKFIPEQSVTNAAGEVFWVQTVKRPLSNADGTAHRVLVAVTDITPRKRAQEALRQSEERLKAVVANTPIILYATNRKGVLTLWEGKGLDAIGSKSGAVVGQSVFDVFSGMDETLDQIRCVLAGAEGTWTSNLQGVIFENRATPLRDKNGQVIGLIGTATDITYRVQAEEALREREAQLQAILDNSPAAIYVKDTEGRFIRINRQFEILFGVEREQVEGKSNYDVFPKQVADAFRENDQEVLAARAALYMEEVAFQEDGLHTYISVKFPLLSSDGVPYAVCGISTDISARKAAEEALQLSSTQLRQLLAREQLLNRLTSAIRNTLDFDTILETTVQEIQQFLQIDRCHFAWYYPEASEPYWEVIEEARNPELPDLTGCYPVAQMGSRIEKLMQMKMLRVDDVETISNPEWQQFLRSLGFTSILLMPMQSLNGALGVISCSHSREVRPWHDNEVELLQAVIAQLAIALNQAELYAQSRAKASELERSLHKLKATQAQLVQTEKISSLGQLVAGVAHEVNNPVAFICGNLHHARAYITDLLNHLRLYQQHFSTPPIEIQDHAEEIDLEFIALDLPEMLSSMLLGTDRIRDIMQSLRNFSRVDEAGAKPANIHDGLDSTLMILQHRLKKQTLRPAIQVVKEYGSLPAIECYPGQLNQVFMNILANAIDAFDDYNAGKTYVEIERNPNVIRISTEMLDSNRVVIRIADNGPGIPSSVQERLFDPFFTTKPIGKGTGLGLSISYQIVTETHKGQLKCISEPPKGTEFAIELPIKAETRVRSSDSEVFTVNKE